MMPTSEPVAGIILAAGGSARMGQPKPLLLWRGKPFIAWVAQTALQARLSPVLVVTGAHTAEIQAALVGLPVQVIHNPAWEAGQSTSLRAGLRVLTTESEAAVFLLADQPQIPAELVRALLSARSQAPQSSIVGPVVNGRRADPVLFDRSTFPDLMALSGDTGGRALFGRYPFVGVPWDDASITFDVDTPKDYERFLAGKFDDPESAS